jgi:hypothetical protein
MNGSPCVKAAAQSLPSPTADTTAGDVVRKKFRLKILKGTVA